MEYQDEQKGFWKGFLIGALSLLAVSAVAFVAAGIVINGVWNRLRDRMQELEKAAAEQKVEYKDRNDYEFLNRFAEIIEKVDSNQVLEYDPAVMEEEAIRAYIAGSGDIYSAYLNDEEWEEMLESSNGSYCGIGVQVTQDKETMESIVVNVFSGGDAKTKGVQEGDIIKRVDGTDVSEMDLDAIVTLIRGEENTEVTVVFYRPSKETEVELTILRKIVQVDTVYAEMLNEETGYIKLTEFDRVSIEQVRNALKDLQKQGMKKLVFDLRSNPGGLLDSVLNIADFFVEKDKLIFIMEDKAGHEYNEYSLNAPVFTGEMAVLVNGYSASASEVFTGIMQDYDRAVIMGEQTFGKGIVQSYFTLDGGGALKLTTEHYFTPLRRSIHGVGLTPEILLNDDPDTEPDELIEAAIEELSK